MRGLASSLCTEPMLMILPRAPGIMKRATALPTWKTPDVGVDEALPLGFGEFVERRPRLHAGIVDQDVDRADLALDPFDRGSTAPKSVTSNTAACATMALVAQRVHRAARPWRRFGR